MKKLVFLTLIGFGTTLTSFSGDLAGGNETKRTAQVNQKMAQDLQLNNYQQGKVDEINSEVLAKIAEMELKYKDNPEMKEKACREVCAIRDQKLESVLSTDQYSEYFRAREKYFQLGMSNATNTIAQNKSASNDQL